MELIRKKILHISEEKKSLFDIFEKSVSKYLGDDTLAFYFNILKEVLSMNPVFYNGVEVDQGDKNGDEDDEGVDVDGDGKKKSDEEDVVHLGSDEAMVEKELKEALVDDVGFEDECLT